MNKNIELTSKIFNKKKDIPPLIQVIDDNEGDIFLLLLKYIKNEKYDELFSFIDFNSYLTNEEKIYFSDKIINIIKKKIDININSFFIFENELKVLSSEIKKAKQNNNKT